LECPDRNGLNSPQYCDYFLGSENDLKIINEYIKIVKPVVQTKVNVFKNYRGHLLFGRDENMELSDNLIRNFYGTNSNEISSSSFANNSGYNREYISKLITDYESIRHGNLYPTYMFYNFIYEYYVVKRKFAENLY
jgi:hypothetical protein